MSNEQTEQTTEQPAAQIADETKLHWSVVGGGYSLFVAPCDRELAVAAVVAYTGKPEAAFVFQRAKLVSVADLIIYPRWNDVAGVDADGKPTVTRQVAYERR